jgi:hypothetical protein
LVLLEEGSNEFRAVKERFYASVVPGSRGTTAGAVAAAAAAFAAAGAGGGMENDHYQLLSIMRVQAPEQLERYSTHRAHVTEALARESKSNNKIGTGEIEKYLWHGPSTLEALRGILVRGFDRFMSKTCMWGKGVYFTPDVWHAERYSASVFSAVDDVPVKVVLLAKVCVGEACVGSKDLYPPPLKPKSTRHFDSTVNRLEDPTIFVTYTDGQAYPMYVCTFVPPKEEEE